MQLEVVRWAAWGAGLSSYDDWRSWARGDARATVGVSPELAFVPPLQRRRLSRLSRLALAAAHGCLEGQDLAPSLVFCSRYGEYHRTYELLQALATGEPVSPAAFSVSVHNTAAGLCTIFEGLAGHASAVAAGPDTVEYAFVDCWALLTTSPVEYALLVYHDEPLPAAYPDARAAIPDGVALALLLRLPRGGQRLSLTSRAAAGDRASSGADERAAGVIRLLTGACQSFSTASGRLEWTWCAHEAH